MRKRDVMLTLVGLPAVVALLCAALYTGFDRESETMTDAVRNQVSGSFLRLPDGVVHYELAGPAPGLKGVRTVVLIHGFSVPYYIWDPTFEALTQTVTPVRPTLTERCGTQDTE